MPSHLGKHAYLVLYNPKLWWVDVILILPFGHENYLVLSDRDVIYVNCVLRPSDVANLTCKQQERVLTICQNKPIGTTIE